MLIFPPFAASTRMEAAARNNPPFPVNEKGVAVALLQTGLVQQKKGKVIPGSQLEAPGGRCAYSGRTWAAIPEGAGQGFRNDAGAKSGSTWALIPA